MEMVYEFKATATTNFPINNPHLNTYEQKKEQKSREMA